MAEIQPLHVLLTLFAILAARNITKNPKVEKLLKEKSEPPLQKLAILIGDVEKKENVPIF